jgi:hypothetical protein
MATLRTPLSINHLRHLTEIRSKTSETPHRLRVSVWADCHPMLAATHINPGRVRVKRFPVPSNPLPFGQTPSVGLPVLLLHDFS